jgi:TrmH family RNA methyltransferase
VVEGVRATEELLRSGIALRGALFTPSLLRHERGQKLLEGLRARTTETLEVLDADMMSAANTDTPQGVMAIADVPSRTLRDLELGNRVRILLLDAVQDPGRYSVYPPPSHCPGLLTYGVQKSSVALWEPNSAISGCTRPTRK